MQAVALHIQYVQLTFFSDQANCIFFIHAIFTWDWEMSLIENSECMLAAWSPISSKPAPK